MNNLEDRSGAKPAVIFEDNKKKYLKCQYRSNQGDLFEIVGYNTNKKVTVKFLDTGSAYVTTTMQNIVKGQVKNPCHPNAFGGYLGMGYYTEHPDKSIYNLWMNLLKRAIDEAHVNSIIDPSWYNYNTFCEWYVPYLESLPAGDYAIDKDLLFNRYYQSTGGRPCYSPSTCVLVPQDMERVLITIRLNRITGPNPCGICDLAKAYLDEGKINRLTYDSIMENYKK